MTGLEGLIARFGVPAVFAGSFVEGETVVTLAGFLAHQGLMSPVAVALAAFAGSVAADQMYFHLARRHSGGRLVGRVAGSRGGRAALGLVGRHPRLFGLGFRFVPGMRTTGPVAMGLAGLPPLRFLAMDVLASALWAGLYTALGYGFSRVIERWAGDLVRIGHQLGAGLGVALAVGLALALLGWWLHRRPARGPRP